MKKVYISIAGFLLCSGMLLAQSPVNRTSNTVVADVLAQIPVQKQAEYNKLIADLSTTGESGVVALVEMMKAPGQGSNSKVDYALSGLSHYVSAKGQESARKVVAEAYVKALEMVQEPETKAFIIRQLQIVGENESVEALAGYLNDERLSGPAARALSSIGSSAAKSALEKALMQRMGSAETQENIINALAETQDSNAEDMLLALANTSDTKMLKVVYNALGRLGSAKSLPVLGDAAKKAGYTMEPTCANEAYIALIKRLVANGDLKTAEKAAKTLQSQAKKNDQVHSREAAGEILLSIALKQDNGKEEATALLVKAMKDKDKDYRNAMLNYGSAFADNDVYVELMKTMLKAKDDAKIDLVNWIGRESKCPEKKDVVRNVEIRFDLTLKQALIDLTKSENFDVVQASVWTMVKIGDKVFIPVLADLLKSSDKQVVLLGEDALMAFNGNITQDVAKAIPDATDDGKIAALELLSVRKADSKLNTVLEQTKSSSPEVKKAAYKALKNVVGEKDFVQLCGMLENAFNTESASSASIPPIQDALIVTVSLMPESNQIPTVTNRMLQVGKEREFLYYPVLASTGDKEALDIILKGFNTSDGYSKDVAFKALLSWNSIDAAEILYNIAKGESDDQIRNQSLNRYVNLVSTSGLTGENKLIFLRKAMDIAKTTGQKVNILKAVQGAGTYLSMLYAGEFTDSQDQKIRSAAAYAVMNIAMNHKEYTGDNVKALLKKIITLLDGADARYEVDALNKHLSEMPDEVGFVSLFNGKDLTGWKGLVANPIARAKMKPAELAKAQKEADERMVQDWKVENGLLVFDGKGYDNLCTEKQYGDFEMYIDWMLDPAGPEADAGVYLRGTPQVQIWDTARVNVGAQVGSGGLYNNQTNRATPLKVADNKLGEWNSFYIKMVGDRVTVYLNGELVTDNVILENYWDRNMPIFPVEQIELQAHGSKVYYRNIYIKELERQEPFKLSAEEEKEGFKILFDGTNMYEWTGNTTDYTLEDGCISLNPSRSFGGNLYTKKEYANFVYRFEFQLTPGANNGIGIRTPMDVDAAYHGMEIQVLDCEHEIYKTITPLQHHGSVYGIIPANANHTSAIKPVGEWNEEEIIADGDHIKVTVNGVVILDGNIRDAVKNGTADHKEHPGLFNKKGHIGFLGHGSPVKFRNIRIKELK